MSRFGSEYHIARATGHCAATGEPLEPGSMCVATLCEREHDEGFDRRDFSLTAWESGARPEGLYSYWKTVVPEPDAKPRLVIDDAVLLDLFERLASDERPQRAAFRFVIGLMLMRKKQLKFTGRETRGEQEFWRVQGRSPAGGANETPPQYEVLNPQLSDDDVRDLMDQLSEVLQSDL